MAETSTFRAAIEFLQTAGVYDVILPFILVFTIVFAILEKTKVFGMEKIGNVEYTRKNLNAMTAFVIALLVVGSAEIVEILNLISAQIVIFLFASVFFLLLVGSFAKEEKGVFLKGGWNTFFMWVMLIGLALIFFNVLNEQYGLLDTDDLGDTSEIVGLGIMGIILIFFIWFVIRDTNPPKAVAAGHKH
ncbi:hypothetical protein ACFLZX_03565 [Nanoarchaeota archaeon]